MSLSHDLSANIFSLEQISGKTEGENSGQRSCKVRMESRDNRVWCGVDDFDGLPDVRIVFGSVGDYDITLSTEIILLDLLQRSTLRDEWSVCFVLSK